MNTEHLIRVAMIDDHDLLRDGICKYLDSFGFQIVFEAENGKDALEKIERESPLPDICIVDINMPVMNGHETATAIRKNYPGIKILAFSVNDDVNDVTKMLEIGAEGYILKGADPDELKKAVHVLYNGGKYFSVGISEIAASYFSKQRKN